MGGGGRKTVILGDLEAAGLNIVHDLDKEEAYKEE